MPTLRIHTHCQVAQKSRHTNQNLSKSMAALSHDKIADLEKTKISATIVRKYLKMNKAQHLTMYIKNRRDSSKFKGCSSFQLLCNLTGKCDEVAYISYTNRWCATGTVYKHPLQSYRNIVYTF
jgi:hypothetical protein